MMYLNYIPSQHNRTTRTFLQKLNQSLWKTSYGQNDLCDIARTIWNNLPDSLKTSESLNTQKHRVKKKFFHQSNNKENSVHDKLLLF